MIRISVDVDDSGFAERMSAMALRAQDLRIPLTEAAEKVKTASRVNFLSQGGTSGGWSPLEPEYGAWKAANYGPLPILVRTGALAESIVGRGAPIDVDAHSMTVSLPNIKYAKFHQYGTEHMAARPIVITPPGFALMVANDIGDYIFGLGN